MKKLVIYGIGDHADLVFAFFDQDSDYTVMAFTVEQSHLIKSTHFGLPVIAFEKIQQHFPPSTADMFVAVGPHELNKIRERFYKAALAQGYRLANYLATQARLWPDIQVGDNTMVDNACQSHPYVTIGDDSVILASNLGHHTHIGHHCFISAALIGGNVIVEDNVFIGMGCNIMSGVRIGKGSIIGMGSMITRDVSPYSLYSTPRTKVREEVDAREVRLF